MPVRPRSLAWWASGAALAVLVALSIGAGCSFTPDEPRAADAPSSTEADAPAERVPRTTPESQQEKVLVAPAEPPAPPEPPNVRELITWRDSTSLGLPYSGGQLVDGVQLPSSGPGFTTWDPVLKQVPNRHWRRYGHDDMVRSVLDVIDRYRETFPNAPPLLIGDLSRPRGGDFGKQWGALGHVSHQNGLDVDVYYPRKDRQLLRPDTPDQVNPRLAQWLTDQFVAEGAVNVFTGPNLSITGPPAIVQPYPNHDDHLHIRYPNPE